MTQSIILTKQKPISLTKEKVSGQASINLNWDAKKPGMFKSLFGSSSLDLDLGCLYELQDGTKSCVQALGNAMGSIKSAPFIQLDEDDRSGNSADGENMHINLDNWDKIKRVLVYAFIYEGASNWSDANGKVVVKTPGNPDITVNLDSPVNGKSMCGIAMLENINGELKVSKVESYFTGHRAIDEAHGFGLNWQRGRK